MGKPRVRILLRGLRRAGALLDERCAPLWEGTEDKSGMSRRDWLRTALRGVIGLPVLIWRFWRAPRPDAVLICYPGLVEGLALWPSARLRGVPIIWDAFIPVFETVVEDRGLLRPGGLAARAVLRAERLMMHAADGVLTDTQAHAAYLCALHAVPATRVRAVPVGVEPELFPPVPPGPRREPHIRVLFYGQCIPLQGIDTILAAALSPAAAGLRFRIIGRGQTDHLISAALRQPNAYRIDWVPWVPYDALSQELSAADICLGIFGATPKAARVVPNKVFQIVSAGKPLVTRDAPDVRELVGDSDAVCLVPPADPQALIAAIRALACRVTGATAPHHGALTGRLSPGHVGRTALREIVSWLDRSGRQS